MKIAIISDTHSRYAAVEAAVQQIEASGAELILHCGDIEDAETVWLFPGTTHFVFGNCDGDRAALQQAMYGTGATLHRPFGNLDLAGKKLAWTHGDDSSLLRQLETCGEYDYVFHGHTHVAADRKSGPTRVINPGALHRVKTKTFLLFDVETGETESVEVT
jgi:uncharacterized protein